MVMNKVLCISVYIRESRRHGDLIDYYTVEFDGTLYTLKYGNGEHYSFEDPYVPSFEEMRIELISPSKESILEMLENRTQAVTNSSVQLLNYPFDNEDWSNSSGVNLYDSLLMEAITKGINSL